MPPLASQAAYLIDKAVAERNIRPEAAGPWATLHSLRPLEVERALQRGDGPFTGLSQADLAPGGATSPLQLGALATACNASAGAYRLQLYPNT